MPALCASIECDYNYESTDSLVTGMSVSGLDVTITGDNLPTDYLSIEIANMECSASSASTT